MKFFNKYIIVIFLLIINVFAHDSISQEETRKLIFDKDETNYINNNQIIKTITLSNFKPFSFIENGKLQGFSIDLLKKISLISGLRFDLRSNIWENNLKDFKNGKYDLIVDISYEKNREEFTLFSDIYHELSLYVFGNKKNNDFKTFYDLENNKVAILRNIYYKNLLLEHDIDILQTKSDKSSAKLVSLNKADYFISTYINGTDAIKSQKLINLKMISKLTEFKKEELRFGINKNQKILKSIINKSLIHITEKEYEDLSKKWINKYIKLDNINLSENEKEYLQNIETLKLCVNKNWFPYEKIDDKFKYTGITSDFIQELQKNINNSIELIPINSWEEAISKISNKSCDIITLASKQIDKTNFLKFTNTLFNTSLVLTTKFDIPFINNVSFIKNKKIAIISNHKIKNFLKNNHPNLELVEVDNIDEGLDKVLKDEVFGVIDTLPTVVSKIQLKYLGKLKIGAKLKTDIDFSMAVLKDNVLLHNILNKAISAIPENEQEKILNKNIFIKNSSKFNQDLFWKIISILFFIFLFLLYRQYNQIKNNQILKESFDKIQTILDTTMEAIVISENGLIIDVNQEFLKLFEHKDKEEVINKQMSIYIEDNYKKTFIKNYKTSYSEVYELLFIKNNGTKFYGLARGKNIKHKNSKFRVSSVLDLTNIKEKEALLIQQSKVATAGEMLENISHQWRQPLSQISTIATGIKLQKEFDILKNKDLIDGMTRINHTVQYLSETIEDFKNFLKPNSNKIKEFNLKHTLHKLKQLTKDAYKYHHIKIITSKKDCNITQNENLLIQALLNITNNSKDAFANKKIKDESIPYIFVDLYQNENIIIKIKDNAGGIEENIINKIFEPYFTTKHKSVGTGIGLYMTFQIINKQMKGHINVKNSTYSYDNKVFTGAEFTITLPKE